MNELQTRDNFQPQTTGDAVKFAEIVAKSELIPAAYRGKPSNILVAVFAGRELGLGAMQSLRLIHVIEGKPVMSADGAVALVLSSPSCVRWDYVETTDRICTIETQRKGSAPARFSFSIEQAAQAGLANKSTWKQYPQAMLRARCAMITARAMYPDLLAGVYDPDEAESFDKRPPAAAATTPVEVYQSDGEPAPFRIVLGQHKGKTFAELSDSELTVLIDGMLVAPDEMRKVNSFLVQLKEAESAMAARLQAVTEVQP